MYRNLSQNIAGGIVFFIALITYTLTLEPTNSWWDCGEYIATAYKLQVGHPPGAPLFLLIANLFSQFAFGDLSKVALMINFMSVLCSAFTILLLFLTTRIIITRFSELKDHKIATLSSAVGALIYTFSDSFWFSAVEGEVYAMSSLFTALVFWAIVKWSEAINSWDKANKWLILIAYLIGLSIGVHLLSLLVIPSIVLIYYFTKYDFSKKSFIIANITGVILLGFIYEFIIPQFVNISGKIEIFFVNQLSLPFNSGTIFFFLIIVVFLVSALRISKKNQYYNFNTGILAFTFLLIGYMSFFTLVIRSNANTPIDENSPEDAVSLLSYLNREQYGSTPLFYGQYFNAETESYKDGNPVFIKDLKQKKYIISDDRKNSVPIYEESNSGIFPRMWSRDQRHVEAYQEWAHLKNVKRKPTFTENLRFFFSYQINHMYLRYFMWNFAGKQNDKQGHGELNNGNWISGFNFIDKRLGPQKTLPEHLKNNPGRNTYYFLPLILGILGIFFHYQKSPKDTWVVLLLFFFTGLAIVIELNQTPFQPRERDYAYAGSFYAFSIWIGIGVTAIFYYLKSLFSNRKIITTVCCLTIFIPFLMAKEGWDDHDRSDRYTAREFAKNYLKSCDQNAILFTMGDNDTFPLWYVQEVEGFRTDVRIVNLSLLNTDWYIDQMKRDAYNGKGVPFSLTREQYKQGTRDVAIFIDKGVDRRLSLSDFNKWIHSDRSETKINFGKDYDYFYTKKISIPVNKDNVINNQLVHHKDVDLILDSLDLDLNTNQLEKKDIMILDLIEKNNWERPIYFAITIGSSGRSFLYLEKYFQLDGMVYKFVPIKNQSSNNENIGRVNTDVLYPILMEEYEWGNLNQNIYLDETNLRMTMNFRNNFHRLAQQLIIESKYAKAQKVLDYAMELMPGDQVPLNYFTHPIVKSYYDINATNEGELLVSKLNEIYTSELNYFFSFSDNKKDGIYLEILKNLQFYNDLVEIATENNHPNKDLMRSDFQKFYQNFLTL